jgi:uncharacterized Zn finger protein
MKEHKIYCEKCEEEVVLISQTICTDALTGISTVFNAFKCHHCGLVFYRKFKTNTLLQITKIE